MLGRAGTPGTPIRVVWGHTRPAGSWSLLCSNYQLNSYIETIKNASVPPRKELQEKWKIHHFELPY